MIQMVRIAGDARPGTLFGGRRPAVRVIGLAVRDGGCRWPDCEKPASSAEAHHIDTWTVDNGQTDLQDGVLLCRHHHMFLHSNHWRIIRDRDEYWLKPPKTEDPAQTFRAMRTKSPQMQELYA